MVMNLIQKETFTIVKPNISKINYENANKFSKQTVDYIETEKPSNLAIDFKEISYISSIGISALSIIKGISKINNCQIVLYNLSSEVLETLEQTGVNTLFKILDDETEVMEYFRNT